jgi:tRNA(fMet)-specific endonuclease VapC
LLDTNAVIYILRERPEGFLQQFTKLEQGEAAISVITYGELFFGLAKSTRRAEGIKTLRELNQLVPTLPLGEEAAAFYGTIRADLESTGKIIDNNDLWIAAHAMASGHQQ